MVKNLKKPWVFAFILIVLVSGLMWFYKNQTIQNAITANTDFSGEPNAKTETLEGDLLGNGTKQKIDITVGERKAKIEIFENEKIVAANVFDYGLVKPTSQYSFIKIDQNKPREYLRWDQFVGPHQVETIILTTANGVVRPVLTADYENNAWYVPFWSSRDNTWIGDINGDGIAEVIEYVDEFPIDSPRLIDPEIEKITRNEFPDDKEDDMWKIVSRENSGKGRGRKVIWNVYKVLSDEPLLFQKTNKSDFEKLTSDILKAMSIVNQQVEGSQEIITKYALAKESIDFNNFVRDFWTQGFPYSQPFDAEN